VPGRLRAAALTALPLHPPVLHLRPLRSLPGVLEAPAVIGMALRTADKQQAAIATAPIRMHQYTCQHHGSMFHYTLPHAFKASDLCRGLMPSGSGTLEVQRCAAGMRVHAAVAQVHMPVPVPPCCRPGGPR
jgi:hypothetical protein